MDGRIDGKTVAKAWRGRNDVTVNRRRWIVGLSLLNVACMGWIASYQTGIVNNIPDFGLPNFDSKKVTGSEEAFSLLETPDGILGMNSYASTALLAGAGGADRPGRLPLLPLLLASKALIDVTAASYLLVNEKVKQRAYCLPCMIAFASTVASALLTIPEAVEAAKHLAAPETRSSSKLK